MGSGAVCTDCAVTPIAWPEMAVPAGEQRKEDSISDVISIDKGRHGTQAEDFVS